MGVASSSEEDESKPKKRKKKKTKKSSAAAEPLPGLDSDLEEEKENEANETFWGNRKSDYYNADYIDEDRDGKLSRA